MRWPIRTQLLLPVLLLLVAVAGISLTTAFAAARQARQQIETRLRTVARFLIEESRFPLTAHVLQQLQSLSGADYLLRPTRAPALTSLPLEPAQVTLDIAPVDDWQALHLGPPVRLAGRTYLAAAIRLQRGPNAGDTLYIFYPESLWRDARWQASWPSLVLGVSLGLASLVLALAQAQRLGHRLHELQRRAGHIAAGDFGPMPLPARDDEIRDLVRSLNEMADRLARLQTAVQQNERLRVLGQVSGGLAHQLRNGLTGARLAVQLFVHEVSPDQDTSALGVALRQLALLETQVKRFLDLGKGPVSRQPCALTALIEEAVDLHRPQCRHAGIDVVWHPPAGPCPLLGDPGQLSQLLVNLLGNAVEAAGPGGTVEVRLQAEGGRYHLAVVDTGPGPPAELVDRLFEPFVTGKPEGVGLGLAVARQVAEGHGGRIGWQRVDGRTRFHVEFPATGG